MNSESLDLNEKQQYIEKLKAQVDTINKILKMGENTVVGSETQKKLTKLKDNASALLRKLETGAYEIAIVGLEKAGKSTVANAMMENNFLPSKDARCTFTSTKIEYNSEDKEDCAYVEFYKSEVFNKDFKNKLKVLGIEDADKYSYDTLELSSYRGLFDRLSEATRMLYAQSLNIDIEDIIRNRESIKSSLGSSVKPFGADAIEGNKLEEYITSPRTAYAVKEVTIKSKRLGKMQNAVIYDVPGFNSPTELHKIQTKERMEAADAIVIVANGEHPSVVGETLKILKESDSDGNRLDDKLFVFANRIEMADDVEANIQETKNEWIKKYGFIEYNHSERIIFGSARAHLESCGVKEQGNVFAAFKKKEAQLPNGDGIDALRTALENYNATERFAVLKRRINKINNDIYGILKEISEHYTDDNYVAYGIEHLEMLDGYLSGSRKNCEEGLKRLRRDIQVYMETNKPISNDITEHIVQTVTKEKYSITDEEVEKVKLDIVFAGSVDDTERLEARLRESKFRQMYDEGFSKEIIKIADKYHTIYSKQILDTILAAIGVSTNSPYFNPLNEELKERLTCFRKEFKLDNKEEDNGYSIYQSLLERFSRDIYEILINSQYGNERLAKFYESIDNFLSMSIFYKKPSEENDLSYIDKTPQEQPLWKKLLFHHYLNFDEDTKNLYTDVVKKSGIKDENGEIKELVDKAYGAASGNSEVVSKEVENAFSKVKPTLSEEFRINHLKSILNSFILNKEIGKLSDKEDFTRKYGSYHVESRGINYNLDYVRKEFDKDIAILGDVLINGFVRAIKIEKPFIARETLTIDQIIKYINGGEFGKFLTSHLRQIKFMETAQLDEEASRRQQNAAIVNVIKGYLEELKN